MLGSQTQAERDKVYSGCPDKRHSDRVFPMKEVDFQAEEPGGKANDGMEFELRQGLGNQRGGQLEKGDPSLIEHPSLGNPRRDSSPKNPGAGAHSPHHS